MEKRYGRKNEKYHAKLNKSHKKISFEKLFVLRICICSVLLAAGILISYADKGGSTYGQIKEVLYKSNTAEDWSAVFSPALKTVKNGGKKVASAIDDTGKYIVKKLGIKSETEASAMKANADKDKDDKAGNKNDEKTDNSEKDDKESQKENKDTAKSESPPEQTKEEPLVFRTPAFGEITSAFGERVHPVSGESSFHTGIDIAAPTGQTIISAAKGHVSATGSDSANGKYVIIEHANGFSTAYAHMSKICVITGEWVDDNTKIGEVGSSGVSTGPHLHFEIKQNGESINPENYITLMHRKEE